MVLNEQGKHCKITSPVHESRKVQVAFNGSLLTDADTLFLGCSMEKALLLTGHSILGRREGDADGALDTVVIGA